MKGAYNSMKVYNQPVKMLNGCLKKWRKKSKRPSTGGLVNSPSALKGERLENLEIMSEDL
jgi:hypothetical protein